jgi:hypothetical protein
MLDNIFFYGCLGTFCGRRGGEGEEGWAKTLKNQLNRENKKKNRKNWTVKKNRLNRFKILKNRPVRFYKSETEKTKPNKTKSKTKKPSQTEPNQRKTEPDWKNQAKPVWTGFCSKITEMNWTETGRSEPVPVLFF